MIERIQLSHGAGGTIMNEMIRSVILANITKRKVEGGAGLDEFDDGASIPFGDREVVVSSDAHTVDPLFFPGGDIGKLSACGAVNDLAMMGAQPLAMTDTIVVEEGFEVDDLKKIVRSMNEVAEEVGMAIIHGDFKVMPKGKLDRMVITTTGIGTVPRGKLILDSGLRKGDKIIITGSIGDHGTVIASLREGASFITSIESDTTPLWALMREGMGAGLITSAKDPTRGGVAMALNEMAERSGASISIDEQEIPLREEVRGACEMLGLDPLELTCEGRAVIGVRGEDADRVLDAIRAAPSGAGAKIVGEVTEGRAGYVIMRTAVGGKRILNAPLGEPTPRIC